MTEPGFHNEIFDMPALDDDCQKDQKENGWRHKRPLGLILQRKMMLVISTGTVTRDELSAAQSC